MDNPLNIGILEGWKASLLAEDWTQRPDDMFDRPLAMQTAVAHIDDLIKIFKVISTN